MAMYTLAIYTTRENKKIRIHTLFEHLKVNINSIINIKIWVEE